MKHAALYVSVAASAGLLLGPPAFAGSLGPADDPAPIGLTASLDAVPTLTPVALPSPYKIEWQQRLQAFEVNFVANVPAQATSPGVDPMWQWQIVTLKGSATTAYLTVLHRQPPS